MKKKFLCLTMGTILLIGGAATTASAADYSGYLLYSNYQNNYTSYHAKTTTSQSIDHKVTSLSGTTKATFWACDNNGTIAYDSHRTISSTYYANSSTPKKTLTFFSKYNKKKGDKIALGMEDGIYHSTSSAKVSGTINFK